MSKIKDIYTVTFNTKGYDGFIDFIKAYAILCVLFGHTFSPILDKVAYGVWAGMQVPLFILVQSFHSYKKDKATVNLAKILTRVVLPFVVFEAVTFCIAHFIGRVDRNTLIYSILTGGGYGPGSYYPWVYVQVALLLPLFLILLKRVDKITALVIFLIVCEGTEILFSVVDLPNHIYRLLAARYILLFYLGWLWVKGGVRINWITIVLSIISLCFILFFEYSTVDKEPWFINAGFRFHRWPCYFFVAYGFTAMLHILWTKINQNGFFVRIIKILAAASYEIFLMQMTVIYLFHRTMLGFITNGVLRYSVWLLIVWTVSIIGGIILNRLMNHHKEKIIVS